MLRDPFEPSDVGNDELEAGESVAVFQSGDAVGFMPSNMLRQLDQEGKQLVGEMQRTVLQIREMQQRVDALVRQARETGMSWSAIGWSTGLTGEGARLKWTDSSE